MGCVDVGPLLFGPAWYVRELGLFGEFWDLSDLGSFDSDEFCGRFCRGRVGGVLDGWVPGLLDFVVWSAVCDRVVGSVGGVLGRAGCFRLVVPSVELSGLGGALCGLFGGLRGVGRVVCVVECSRDWALNMGGFDRWRLWLFLDLGWCVRVVGLELFEGVLRCRGGFSVWFSRVGVQDFDGLGWVVELDVLRARRGVPEVLDLCDPGSLGGLVGEWGEWVVDGCCRELVSVDVRGREGCWLLWDDVARFSRLGLGVWGVPDFARVLPELV